MRWPGTALLWPDLLTGVMRLEYAWNQNSVPQEHSVWHREQDAMLRFVRDLLEAKAASQETLQRIDEQVTAQAKDACRYAVDSPYPAPETAFEDVFA